MVRALRPKYVPYIVIGIVLVYLSLYGLEGFGLGLTGTNFKEDFDVYPNGWTTGTGSGVWGTPTINPAGQLELNSPVNGRTSCMKFWTLPEQFTVEFRLKVDLFGLPAGGINIQIYDSTYWIQFLIFSDHLWTGLTANTENFTTTTDNNWHVWTLVCDHTGSTFDVYRDSVKLTSFHYLPASVAPKISLDGFGGTSSSTITHFDYFYMDEGLKPPGGVTPTYSDVTISVQGQGTTVPATGHYATSYLVGGSLTLTATPASGWAFDYMMRNGVTTSSMTLSSLGVSEQVVVYFKQGSATTGTLRVFASYNGAYVVASVTASGPQTVSGSTTTSPSNPLAFTVTAGMYTVSGTYASGSASPVTVTVPAGGSADASLNFGGSSPPPDFVATIIAAIKNFFNQFAVKSIFMVAGVGLTIGGSIMFLLKGKGERSRPAPYPYY
jgi:hypothetical protein